MWSTTVRRLRPRTVVRWLAPAGWPAHVIFGAATVATVLLAILFRQPAIVEAVLAVVAHYALGLCASFAIHELGHAVALLRAPGVTAITLERTLLRISVLPQGGAIRGRDAFLGAISGPLCCVIIGVLLWLLAPFLLLHFWYLGHAIFLTPLFSDGRIMLTSFRAWSTSM